MRSEMMWRRIDAIEYAVMRKFHWSKGGTHRKRTHLDDPHRRGEGRKLESITNLGGMTIEPQENTERYDQEVIV